MTDLLEQWDKAVRFSGTDGILRVDAKLARQVAAALREAHAKLNASEPVAWIDASGHPKHLSYRQGARERELYGPLQPLVRAEQRGRLGTDRAAFEEWFRGEPRQWTGPPKAIAWETWKFLTGAPQDENPQDYPMRRIHVGEEQP